MSSEVAYAFAHRMLTHTGIVLTSFLSPLSGAPFNQIWDLGGFYKKLLQNNHCYLDSYINL